MSISFVIWPQHLLLEHSFAYSSDASVSLWSLHLSTLCLEFYLSRWKLYFQHVFSSLPEQIWHRRRLCACCSFLAIGMSLCLPGGRRQVCTDELVKARAWSHSFLPRHSCVPRMTLLIAHNAILSSIMRENQDILCLPLGNSKSFKWGPKYESLVGRISSYANIQSILVIIIIKIAWTERERESMPLTLIHYQS